MNFLDELMMEREKDKFQSVYDSQLVKKVRKLLLEGVLTDANSPCALLARKASGDQSDDLQFKRAQTVVVSVHCEGRRSFTRHHASPRAGYFAVFFPAQGIIVN